jgi:ribosomal-protein-serine acetyltransferase
MASLPQPLETLETTRLWLRAPRLSDAPELHAAVIESLPELRPYMRWVTPGYTLTECEANTRAAMAEFATGEGLRYHFFDKVSGQFVGNASFHHIDPLVPKLELGYWLRTSRSGGGLMREAVAALCEMAEQELGAARLEIRCDTRNLRSARVAEACGFGLEGILRNACRDPQGRLRDTRLYARVRH